MRYKVAILAAGVGSRMGGFSEHLNKVLIPIQGKPTICHIIEYFPEDVEIVIAVGYKKESLIKYLETSYPNRKLTFVEVEPFQGEGSGPGYSLYCCKPHLECPFIHIAGDTLVREKIPEPDSNWLGVAEVEDTSRFCSAKIEGGDVIRIDDKVQTANKHAYIGLIGVYDYESFWNALEENKEVIDGEIQVSNGIQKLKEIGLKSKTFTWFDTGTPNSYEHAQKNYFDGEGSQGD
ncbi:NTP transferase domain-containing protein [Candidatus Pacearchaeota archaeon]|nr:NTP transferase domain-containing protein [Candidatus Pacearchaeota archaeon]